MDINITEDISAFIKREELEEIIKKHIEQKGEFEVVSFSYENETKHPQMSFQESLYSSGGSYEVFKGVRVKLKRKQAPQSKA